MATRYPRPDRYPAPTLVRPRHHPPPPKSLAPAEVDYWNSILSQYALEGDAALSIFEMACNARAHERMCNDVIAKEGVIVIDPRGNKRAHPLVREAAVARNSFLAAMRALNLDLGPTR
jgi:hypothetical protein